MRATVIERDKVINTEINIASTIVKYFPTGRMNNQNTHNGKLTEAIQFHSKTVNEAYTRNRESENKD